MLGKHFEHEKEALEVLEQIGQHFPGGFFIYKADSTEEILYANKTVFEIFGCEDLEDFRRMTGNTFKGMVYPDDYDMVYTGDLAKIGLDILTDILTMEGYNPCGRLNDCGHMIYDTTKQHAETGGSGAGCSSSVFAGHIYRKLKNKELEKILFVPTGALLSTVSSYQKNSIPSIAHAVVISNKKGKQNA